MTLWQIDERINKILENDFYIDEETGEVFFTEDLDKLDVERTKKIENIALYVKNLKYEAEAIKNEIDNLKMRAETKKKKAEKLTNYLDEILGGEKLETSKVALSYRKSTAVKIENEELLPDEFMTIKIDKKPDKVAIAKLLKNGETIIGCELIEKQNLQIK
jgi:chaperonin cofactor prefoldin